MSEASEIRKALAGVPGMSVLKYAGSDVGFLVVDDGWLASLGEERAVEHLASVMKSCRPVDGSVATLEPAQ